MNQDLANAANVQTIQDIRIGKANITSKAVSTNLNATKVADAHVGKALNVTAKVVVASATNQTKSLPANITKTIATAVKVETKNGTSIKK